VIEGTKKHFGEKLYKTFIRENISLAECPSFRESIFEYSPRSNGAADYEALAKEFLKREWRA
jgi:chromosome partitioning protein